MNKIIIFVYCILLFFLAVGLFRPVSAQALSPTPVQLPTIPPFLPSVEIPQPGINCGIVSKDNPAASKCCQSIKIKPQLSEDTKIPFDDVEIGFIKINFDLKQKINDFMANISKPFVDPFEIAMNSFITKCIQGVANEEGEGQCFCEMPKLDEITALRPMCEAIENNTANENRVKEAKSCRKCIENEGVWTGLGCIYVDPADFIQKTVFSWGIGITGSLGLACIIYAAFMIQTSRGNPERVKKAQELLTSCITGLLLIIFSVFILRVIGVDILQIPFLKIE